MCSVTQFLPCIMLPSPNIVITIILRWQHVTFYLERNYAFLWQHYQRLNRACGGQVVQWSRGTSCSSQKTPSSQVVITSSPRTWTLFTSWNLVITGIPICVNAPLLCHLVQVCLVISPSLFCAFTPQSVQSVFVGSLSSCSCVSAVSLWITPLFWNIIKTIRLILNSIVPPTESVTVVNPQRLKWNSLNEPALKSRTLFSFLSYNPLCKPLDSDAFNCSKCKLHENLMQIPLLQQNVTSKPF